ncbi:uncharacterized protein LOC118645235 [Monomorium pharaonis]|uniref:uncharacterized protein LOC118645235 n=1 Tax=Monomorium pharaonis TaxID=307658 RepID=UPI001747CAB5|nr:uncharacterized protein LOC118645235 [Monomorium pharaonis]
MNTITTRVGASHNFYDVETGWRKIRIEECQVRKNIKYLIKKKLVFYILITSIFVGERPVALVHPFRTQYGRLSLRRRREAEVAEEAVPARRRRIGEAPVAIVAPAVAAAALPPPPPPSPPPRVIPVVDLVSGNY